MASSKPRVSHGESGEPGPEEGQARRPVLIPVRAVTQVFVGREREIARIERGLADVGLAAIAGLPGVGKSALAQRVAAGWAGPVTRLHVRAGQPVAEVLDDLRRSLAHQAEATPELRTDKERLEHMAARLDGAAALAVIEDADRLGEAAADLVAGLAASVRRGRVLVTSRTRIHDRGSGPERVDLVLDGLGEDAARQLWARLDDLYGARSGFDAAWQRTRGNPFYLRRAHEGDLDAADPVRATVASLEAGERRMALALAMIGMPVARELAARLVPIGASAAIRGLIAKLVVEPNGCGELVIHDLFGDGLIAAAGPDEVVAAHRAIARALEESRLGPIPTVRLRVRHLIAAGLHGEARDLLLARASELVRGGGAGELLRGLDQVVCESDGEARLARARAMARMLDLGRAYAEVVALGADRPDASAELRATFAHLALLTLRLDVAERVSRAGLASPGPLEVRVRFATVYMLTAAYRGHGDTARAALDRAAADLPPAAHGYAAFSRAFSLWIEERDGEAEQVMRTAWPLFRGTLAFRAGVLAPTFMVTVLARAGKLADAATALAEAESALARFDDSLMRVSLRALRATLLESQGSFAAARDEAAAVEDAFAGAGHRLGALWSMLLRARSTLYCGQVRAGRRLLDQVTREAATAGASLVVQLAARAAQADPWYALTGPPPAERSRPGEERRDRVLAVLRSLGAGQVAVARGYRAAVERTAVDPLERALLAVADWGFEVGSGGCPGDDRIQQACEAAARGGVDPELVPAIAAWLADRLAQPAERRRVVIIDRRSDTIRSGAIAVQLARRPALRRLLYALLDAPERVHDKPALARAIWSVDYHSVHDGALWVNIKRLRSLLASTGIILVCDDEGVRLRLEPDCELQIMPP